MKNMMKGLESDIKSLRKSLKTLTQKTEQIAMDSFVKSLKTLTHQTEKMAVRLDKLEKTMSKDMVASRSPRKPTPKKAGTKKKAPTATDTVLGIISRSKKGVDTATLKKKTGFDTNKIRVIVYRLKKQGKIKSVSRGHYIKA
jgi:hypothetical protein